MAIFQIVLIVIVAYFFLVFFVLRLIAPFMGFGQYQLPKEIPQEINNKIQELENQSVDSKEYLQAVYGIVLNKTLYQWKHTRFQAALRLPRLFVSDLQEIWQTKDFLYCTAINYMVFVILVKSKFFKANDIKIKYVFLNFVPHQYLQVCINNKWIDVDPAGAGIRGIGLGHHVSWFG